METDHRPLITAVQRLVWARPERAASARREPKRAKEGKRDGSPELHTYDRVKRFVLVLAKRTLLRTQHAELFQERGVLLDGETELGLHHEVLDHGRCASTNKTGCGVEVLGEIRWNALVGWTWGPAAVEIIVRCGGAATELGGHVYLGRRVRLDLEDAEAGRI